VNANQDPTQFKNRMTRRIVSLAVVVLAVAFVAFIWGPRLGGTDNWNVVMTVATLLAVIAALFLDDIKGLLHSPKIELRVGDDLLDEGADMIANLDAVPAWWIRGQITNVGDRGVEKCRLRLLDVHGPQLPEPEQLRKIRNGFLQWQGGIRDSMRLNPGESWIFDVGTRSLRPDSDVVLWTYFVPAVHPAANIPAISCVLRTPGTYTVTLAVYGDNIASTEHSVRITIRDNDMRSTGIEFPDAPPPVRTKLTTGLIANAFLGAPPTVRTKLIIGLIANALLFVSGLILLLGIAPFDWSSERARQDQAIVKLRQNRHIAIGLHPVRDVTINFGKEGGIFDADAFEVLTKMIRKHSAYSNTVPWDKVVGIGYGTMNVPVGSGKTIEGLHSLVVTTLPQDPAGTEMENFPVGLLDDLNKWVATSHQRSLTFWAALLLTLGFSLQVVLSIWDLCSLRRRRKPNGDREQLASAEFNERLNKGQ
jgi:hypothetical protein